MSWTTSIWADAAPRGRAAGGGGGSAPAGPAGPPREPRCGRSRRCVNGAVRPIVLPAREARKHRPRDPPRPDPGAPPGSGRFKPKTSLEGAAVTVGTDQQTLDELCVNTIRTLSMDAVQQANSGHPGTPMALAPVAYLLYTRIMRHNPQDPHWPGRDRFVLSCGHASMLLYSVLHLTGYDVTLDQIKKFRQIDSPCAGHPEYGHVPGVETTTGPLGQGIATAVGMALGERMLAARFNRGEHSPIDSFTYFIASDGDMEEGIASEASSLAGHLGVGKLIGL